MNTKDYVSDNCVVEFLSDLSSDEAEKMIGKTVARVDAQEYSFTITFSDGSSISCNGSRWGECALGIDYKD